MFGSPPKRLVAHSQGPRPPPSSIGRSPWTRAETRPSRLRPDKQMSLITARESAVYSSDESLSLCALVVPTPRVLAQGCARGPSQAPSSGFALRADAGGDASCGKARR